MPRNRIYFISDVHLGARLSGRSNGDQEASLVAFLRSIRDRAEVLYIVGDLFDFWFEYRTVVPSRGGKAVFALHALVEAGVRVICLPGNHDVWLGDYLSEQVGLQLPGGPVAVEHQGRRIYITHGDELHAGWKSGITRFVLKNRLCISLFRLLHPDLGALLARATSRLSTRCPGRTVDPIGEVLVRIDRDKIASRFDVVVSGHYHRPFRTSLEGATILFLGDWRYRNHYAVMENGDISLKEWIAP